MTATRRLWRCERGGTGFIEIILVLAMAAVVVVAGARTYGEVVRAEFESDAERTEVEISASAAAGASSSEAQETEPSPPASPDWRRAIDLLVAVPLALLLIGGALRWARRRRDARARRKQLDDEARRRAERLRAAASAGYVDSVPGEQIAQMVAVHPGRAGGARDVAVVSPD